MSEKSKIKNKRPENRFNANQTNADDPPVKEHTTNTLSSCRVL
jgi:hypothetical protein